MQLGMIGSGRTGANKMRRLCGGRVSDSGEGRWMIEAAIEEGVPTHLLTALYERFTSRGDGDLANQVLSVMRNTFGGHVEKPARDHP